MGADPEGEECCVGHEVEEEASGPDGPKPEAAGFEGGEEEIVDGDGGCGAGRERNDPSFGAASNGERPSMTIAAGTFARELNDERKRNEG